MQQINLSLQTFREIKQLLAEDKYYQNLMINSQQLTEASPQEILESCAYVLSLASPAGPGPNPLENPKYLHTTSILQAVVSDRSEAEVQRLINLSSHNKQELFSVAMKVFVYARKWISLLQASTFLGRPLNQSELSDLAYAAGAGENKEFLVSLRNLDSKLLNYAYEGALDYGEVELVERLGLEFTDYRAICQQAPVSSNQVAAAQLTFNALNIILLGLVSICLSFLI